jgi:hypothetical protein
MALPLDASPPNGTTAPEVDVYGGRVISTFRTQRARDANVSVLSDSSVLSSPTHPPGARASAQDHVGAMHAITTTRDAAPCRQGCKSAVNFELR